jgi:hypothetical protein
MMPRIQEAIRSRGVDDKTTFVDFTNRELLPVLRAVLREVRNVTGAATTFTASAYLTGGDYLALVDASAGTVILTLPEASTWPGKAIVCKKIDSSFNEMRLATIGTETIDGAATAGTTTQYGRVSVVSDGENWYRWD